MSRTKDELVAASEHIHLDLSTAVGVSRHMARSRKVDPALHNQHVTMVYNALMASVTMAVRSLVGFGYGLGAQKNTDIFAADYVTDWENVRPDLDPTLKEVFDRASKEVAHLSFSRGLLGDGQRGWNYFKIYNAIVPLHNAFVKHADRTLLGRPLWDATLGTTLKEMPHDRSGVDFLDFEASFTDDFGV